MRKITVPAAISWLAVLALAGCSYEDQWHGATGSPAALVQPAAYHPSGQAASGELRGCLSGATNVFNLVEERTATVYRLQTNEDPEAHPNAREITESLRLNNGKMVAVTGEVKRDDAAPGAPGFEIRSIAAVSDRCPAALEGGVNELNRPPATRLDVTHAGSLGTERGSMRMTRPPVSLMPVNPAH